MKKLVLICAVGLWSFSSGKIEEAQMVSNTKSFSALISDVNTLPVINKVVDSIYTALDLQSLGLQRNIFFNAYKGYEYLLSKGMLKKSNLLTILDYSQSSNSKRLYVIDLDMSKVLFNTYVSHGKNSGAEYARSFSNSNNSNKSSLGFLITAETYKGKDGYSMHFDGVEPGFNDHVRERSIVMHGSWYVNARRADAGAMMGRSEGCPALSFGEYRQVIDVIKEGSCFFAYYPDKIYAQRSQILNAQFTWPALQQIFKNQEARITTHTGMNSRA